MIATMMEGGYYISEEGIDVVSERMQQKFIAMHVELERKKTKSFV